MRIALFVGTFPLLSETFIVRQITGLLEGGHDVHIYAECGAATGATIHADVYRYNLLDRTTYMDMPPLRRGERFARAIPRLIRLLTVAPDVTLTVLNPLDYGRQALSLSALHRLFVLANTSSPYDVAHAHFGPNGHAFRFAKALWKIPFVVTFHGYDFSLWPRLHGAACYDRLFRVADAVTVNSGHTRDRVAGLGCPVAKIYELPMGLNLARFSFRERTLAPGEPVRLVTVSRLVEKKGLEYAIRAVARARESHPTLRYDIVGDGPLRPHLEHLVRRLRLEESVTFHGARDGEDVRRIMDGAHLFMLASVTATNGDQEGQGVVLQEAQARGLPVLATDHGPFPESVVPGRSAFLVPERDVAALAERLAYLVERPEVWPEMGRVGRAYVEEKYDIRRLNRRLVELYHHIGVPLA